jgi:hypothetical protein
MGDLMVDSSFGNGRCPQRAVHGLLVYPRAHTRGHSKASGADAAYLTVAVEGQTVSGRTDCGRTS